MHASRSATTQCKGISLSPENENLHAQLQKAVKDNLTLRLECRTDHQVEVLYLRKRSVSEFFREAWDSLVGKGEIAAAAKQAAWDAVHQALNERIASARTDLQNNSESAIKTATKEESAQEAEKKSWERYGALKNATSDARATAVALYPHIMGIKTKSGQMAIISERFSIRLNETPTLQRPLVSPTKTNPHTGSKTPLPDELPPIEGRIALLFEPLYKRASRDTGVNSSGDTATCSGPATSESINVPKAHGKKFEHVEFRYKPDEAILHDYRLEYWKPMHITALKEAMSKSIEQGESQAAFVIDVDNAQIFDELRQQLEQMESDRAWDFHPLNPKNMVDTSGPTRA